MDLHKPPLYSISRMKRECHDTAILILFLGKNKKKLQAELMFTLGMILVLHKPRFHGDQTDHTALDQIHSFLTCQLVDDPYRSDDK